MRRSNPLPAVLAGFVLTCFVLSPAPAVARQTAPSAAHQTTAVAPAQLVRAGDSAMSCEALTAEINQLAAADQMPVADTAPAAPPKKRRGGFLRVLGHAAPFLGPLGMIGGGVSAMVASSAVSAASTAGAGGGGSRADAEAMMAQSRIAMQRAMAGPSIESQRRDRLTEIFEARHC